MRTIQFLFFGGMLVIIAGVLSPLYLHKLAGHEVPVYGQAPKFSLQLADGEEFSKQNLKNRISLLNFFFTSCPSVCPAISGEVSSLHKQFSSNPQLQFISVSIDPERDSPQALQAYSAKFGADPQRWHFLRGEMSEVNGLLEGLKLSSGESAEMHTTRLVLLDKLARVRGYYDPFDVESLQKLKNDLQSLL